MERKYAGLWVGESMGIESSPAHLWRLRHEGRNLYIHHRWEHEAAENPHYWYAYIQDDLRSFRCNSPGLTGWFVGEDYFIVPGWDTNDIRGGVGPAYDVVFSRPGIGELQSRAVWESWLRENDQPRSRSAA
jgi:hypothetical protein